MIEHTTLSLFKRYAPKNRHNAFCLGDQRPTVSTGYANALSLFKHLGYSNFYDIDYNGNALLNFDLNQPVSHRYHGMADLLYDGGVCEHVANISQALTTMVHLCAEQGTLVQCVPQNAYGASYYGIDPTLLKDFYELNGFETLELFLLSKRKWRTWLTWMLQKKLKPADVNALRRKNQDDPTSIQARAMRLLADDHPLSIKRHPWQYDKVAREVPTMTMVYYVGRRVKMNRTILWPHQTSYPAA